MTHNFFDITASDLLEIDKACRRAELLLFSSTATFLLILTQGFVYHDHLRSYNIITNSATAFRGWGIPILFFLIVCTVWQYYQVTSGAKWGWRIRVARKNILIDRKQFCRFFDGNLLKFTEVSYLTTQVEYTLVERAKKVLQVKRNIGEDAFSEAREMLDDMYESASNFCSVSSYNRLDTRAKREIERDKNPHHIS